MPDLLISKPEDELRPYVRYSIISSCVRFARTPSAAHAILSGRGPPWCIPSVYQALAKPIVGHLDPFFIEIMQDVQELLKRIFGTKEGSVLVISGTGSAGMEAAVSNFVEPGSKFMLANGIFLRSPHRNGEAPGRDVVRLEKPWGDTSRTGKF